MNEVYLTEKSPHLLIFCIKYVSHCDRALISLSHLDFIFLESQNLLEHKYSEAVILDLNKPQNSIVWMYLFLFAIMRI